MDIRESIPVTKVCGRGNKVGHGRNLFLLRKMKLGDSVWNVSRNKCNSIRGSALKAGIKIKIRVQPNGKFAIWRLT